MKMSTKGRYAARAMLDLAIHCSKGPVLLREIASRQRISEKYLERIMAVLVTAGLARSQRGQHGGFSLAKPPREIRLRQVVQAVEGTLAPVSCVDDQMLCEHVSGCVTREIWGELKQAMVGVLDSFTLAEMMEMQERKREKQSEPVYHI